MGQKWIPHRRLRDLNVGECILQVGSKSKLLRLLKFAICNKTKKALMTKDILNPIATVIGMKVSMHYQYKRGTFHIINNR